MTKPSWQDYGTYDESEHPQLWDGVVGAWCPSLGPTGGRLHDVSRFGNWGTLTNMDNATDWVVDDGQYALQFDGTNTAGGNTTQNLVSVPRDYGVDVVSVSLWCKPIEVVRRGLFSALPYTTPRLSGGITTGNQIEIYRQGGGYVTSTATVTQNAWNHVVATSTGTVTAIYINGKFSNSAAHSASVSLGTSFTLGNSYWGAFEGFLDDIQIRFRTMLPNEVWDLYQLGRGGILQRRRRTLRRTGTPAEAAFRAYWARRQNQLIGGGV